MQVLVRSKNLDAIVTNMSRRILTDENLIEAVDKHLTFLSKVKIGFRRIIIGKNRGRYTVNNKYYSDLVGFLLFLRMNGLMDSDRKFSIFPLKM